MFSLLQEIREGIENSKSHSSRLARYDREMSFHLFQSDKVESIPRKQNSVTFCDLINLEFYIDMSQVK